MKWLARVDIARIIAISFPDFIPLDKGNAKAGKEIVSFPGPRWEHIVTSKVTCVFTTALHQKHLAGKGSMQNLRRCIILWLAFRIPNPLTIHLELLP